MENRAELCVGAATTEEWPQLVALRADYFARRNAPVQSQGDAAAWYVARADDRVLAAQALLDDASALQTWIMGTFCERSRRGRLALAKLLDFTHARADADDYMLCGVTEPDNQTNLEAALHRGWIVNGVMIVRPRESERGAPCPA